jgi:hypothetical protein
MRPKEGTLSGADSGRRIAHGLKITKSPQRIRLRV